MTERTSVRLGAFIALFSLFFAFSNPAHAVALSITTPSTQTAVSGSAFSLQIVASGGSGGNQFAIASGTLPTGLALDANTGIISGTPSTSESKTISVRVTDGSSATATTSSFAINTGWMVSTYAGNGNATASGDGGAATSAGMDPHGLSLTSDGTLYFSDGTSRQIRKISTSGTISTVFTPTGMPSGLVVLENGDIIYNEYTSTTRLKKWTASNSSITWYSAATPTFDSPRGLIADANGNYFVTAAQYGYLYKVGTNATATLIAGTGTLATSGDGGAATSASVNAPGDIAVDSAGNIFFTELNGNTVRKINTSGTISTVIASGTYSGDGGPSSSARTAGVWGIAIDGGGNIFFGEKNGVALRRIDAVTGIVTRVAGTGSLGTNGSPVNGISSVATFSNLTMSMRFDRSGNLFWVDYSNKLIRKIANLGVPFTTPVVTFPLTALGTIAKGVNQTLTATASTTGTATFFANGKRIPGCISKPVTGTAPITVTCTWKPITSGGVNLSAILTPSDTAVAGVRSQLTLSVGRRTTTR
jgi:streptogramin lyase